MTIEAVCVTIEASMEVSASCQRLYKTLSRSWSATGQNRFNIQRNRDDEDFTKNAP